MNVIDRFDKFIAAPEHVSIVATREYKLKAVACDLPILVVPLEGTKRLRHGADNVECTYGSFLMTHRALRCDVENIPDGATAYRALAIAFPWRVVDVARTMFAQHPRPAVIAAANVTCGNVACIAPALQSYLETDASDPLAVDHRAIGLLLALAQSGHDAFLGAHDQSVAARLRLMIAAAPSKDWQAIHFEDALHVSSATLRRRLRDEGTSLRAVLLEARLHHGLMLLQMRGQSVKAAALACGYRSVPSFSRAFAERFGVDPSAIARN